MPEYETRQEHKADIDKLYEARTTDRKSHAAWMRWIIELIAIPSILAFAAFMSLQSQADGNEKELEKRAPIIAGVQKQVDANARAIEANHKGIKANQNGINYIQQWVQAQCKYRPADCVDMPSRPIVDGE